jgi:hypothetical protein
MIKQDLLISIVHIPRLGAPVTVEMVECARNRGDGRVRP